MEAEAESISVTFPRREVEHIAISFICDEFCKDWQLEECLAAREAWEAPGQPSAQRWQEAEREALLVKGPEACFRVTPGGLPGY